MATYLMSLMQAIPVVLGSVGLTCPSNTPYVMNTHALEGMAGLLSQGGLEVKEVTTDPNSGAGRAGESLFKKGLLANLPNLKTRENQLRERINFFRSSRKEPKQRKPNFWVILLWMYMYLIDFP